MVTTDSRRQSGLSLVELMLGLVVIVMITAVLMGNLAITYRSTRAHKDKVFAFSTAQRILAEMHGRIEAAGDPDYLDVDAFDDGTATVATLTLATDSTGSPVPPDHPASRNIRRAGAWQWSRQIAVRPLPGVDNRNLRYVTVTVFKRDGNGVEQPTASLSSVVNTQAAGFPTTQVFDLYLLAIESVPGWWVDMEGLRAFVESMLSDLAARNPGLDFRTHWITKSSYGRNPMYRPYINTSTDSEQPTPFVYYYPGLLGTGPITNYYGKDIIKARLGSDIGGINEYDANTNPHPYALADWYNHAMRLPREREFHQERVAAIAARREAIETAERNGTVPPAEFTDMSEEPTLRLLLEDMNANPDSYRSALMINLHGEMLPVPPLRNYSDAARQPRITDLRGVRVVTHPEQLRTARPSSLATGEDVVLRVHAYTSDPANYTGPAAMSSNYPIGIQVMGVDLRGSSPTYTYPGMKVECLPGGVSVGGTSAYQPMGWAKHYSDSSLLAGEMHYNVAFYDLGAGEEKFSVIWLWNTPVVAPTVADPLDPTKVRGLYDNERSRLYGLEYVPAPTELARDFSRDLYTAGDGPKNTARWRITLPTELITNGRFVDSNGFYYSPSGDVELTVRTRIYDSSLSWDVFNTGQLYPTPIDPENFSETYTWWADQPEDVPYTERAQFLGDPRHNPYKDLLEGALDFPSAYNPYHESLAQNSESAYLDYPALDPTRLQSRWMGRVRADVPRFFELYRRALVQAGTVFSTVSGWSFHDIGLGNEIGADARHGYPDSLPMHLQAWGDPLSVGYVNNITPDEGSGTTGGRRLVRSSESGGAHWWGIPWLGELYPDPVWDSQWYALDAEGHFNGNLLAGTGAGEFYRQLETDAYVGTRFEAHGTALEVSQMRTGAEGCTSFFNIGTSTSTFHHQDQSGKRGSLTDVGPELATAYNLGFPDPLQVGRPFGLTLSGDGGVPPEFALVPYALERYGARMLCTYYDHQTAPTGSGVVQLASPSGGSSAYMVMSGLDEDATMTSPLLARYTALSLLHSYFEAGDPTNANRTIMPPRVRIVSPQEVSELDNPVDVDVQWEITWTRWDGLKYTTGTSSTFSESESALDYALLYSLDNGRTWSYVQDDSAARPGERPAGGYVVPDTTAGNESYLWPLPAAQFPEGPVLLRVEAYQGSRMPHYAHHQVRMFINR